VGKDGNGEVIDLGKLTEEAAEVIRKKLGAAGTIIVIASAPGQDDDVYFACWRGTTLKLLGLMDCGRKLLEDRLLPKPAPALVTPVESQVIDASGEFKRGGR